jgi:hypothetical protein
MTFGCEGPLLLLLPCCRSEEEEDGSGCRGIDVLKEVDAGKADKNVTQNSSTIIVIVNILLDVNKEGRDRLGDNNNDMSKNSLFPSPCVSFLLEAMVGRCCMSVCQVCRMILLVLTTAHLVVFAVDALLLKKRQAGA